MAMLGASLSDMDALALKMAGTTGDIGACKSSTTSSTNAVVSSVTQDARNALSQIEGQLTSLRTSVASSRTLADSTQWTGSNADRFRSAAGEFDEAMKVAEGHTQEAFSNFQASIQAMADSLAEYHNSFAAALTNAEASTDSMNQAVTTQREQLAAVMNTGLNIG